MQDFRRVTCSLPAGDMELACGSDKFAREKQANGRHFSFFKNKNSQFFKI